MWRLHPSVNGDPHPPESSTPTRPLRTPLLCRVHTVTLGAPLNSPGIDWRAGAVGISSAGSVARRCTAEITLGSGAPL
jgi:hypothetical protein